MTASSASTLTLAPEQPGSGAGASTDTPVTGVRPSWTAREQANERGATEGYWAWLDHVWPAASCSNPVQLYGSLATVNAATGEVVEHRHTASMPDGVLYKACGNRRTTVCPSCAETYRRDAYQLIRAGLVGGKTITGTVAEHPAVFATLTALSFGPVHTRTVKRHRCTDRKHCDCLAEPCHARRDTSVCEHGASLSCTRRHGPGEKILGQPLCLDCYDHQHQAVWNTCAGELWRRTRQAIDRHAATLARQRGIPAHRVTTDEGRTRTIPPVRVSYAKVAEYQARGVVHFHALIRLDGTDPDHPNLLTPPPAGADATLLENAIRQAVTATAFTTGPHPQRPDGWPIAWGSQLDLRPVKLAGDASITDGQVAGYLAKYATKATEATGHTSQRLTPATVRRYADQGGTHVQRLIAACWALGEPEQWHQLRRWAHMLGFGGHFLTKAHRYSITFGQLRHARVTWRRGHNQPHAASPEVHAADHTEETTLIVGALTYAGTGWRTTGDALLANTAADQARRRARTGKEELDHQHATALAA